MRGPHRTRTAAVLAAAALALGVTAGIGPASATPPPESPWGSLGVAALGSYDAGAGFLDAGSALAGSSRGGELAPGVQVYRVVGVETFCVGILGYYRTSCRWERLERIGSPLDAPTHAKYAIAGVALPPTVYLDVEAGTGWVGANPRDYELSPGTRLTSLDRLATMRTTPQVAVPGVPGTIAGGVAFGDYPWPFGPVTPPLPGGR